MKSLSFFDLKNFAKWFQAETENAQLQDIWTNGQMLIFQFYKFKDIFLCVDLAPNIPLIAVSDKRPPVAKKPKPTVIFLQAHAKNLRITKVWTQMESGRVLYMSLDGGDKNCEVEIRLIPKAPNVIVHAGDKKISWEKTRELPTSQHQPGDVSQVDDWAKWNQEFWNNRFGRSAKGTSEKAAIDPRPRAIEKKKKALLEIQAKLNESGEVLWQELGESLKVTADVKAEWQEIYDSKKSRVWNMENAFRQVKLARKKREGTLERVSILEKEVSELERDLLANPHFVGGPQVQSAAKKILEKTDSKARRLDLGNGMEALIGKSGKDNLAILRQAQAWDLWLHLKDYPGAHAILVRPRNKEVPNEAIQKVAEWVIRESLSKEKLNLGGRYEVIVVETRYVRPIKGDKLGRVTYHHPRTYSFASKA